MNTSHRFVIGFAIVVLAMDLWLPAQDHAPAPVVAATKAATPASAKETAPNPSSITQAEKDAFHRAYTEYLELQNKWASQMMGPKTELADLGSQMLALKTKLTDIETKSAVELGPKTTAMQQMFTDLAKRCVAPKAFDRMTADCQDPEKPKQP